MRIAVAGGTGIVGRYVVQAARAAGHDTVVLARSSGIDLRRETDLGAALQGVEVIVDTTNPPTTNRAKATAFFTEVTGRLHTAGSEAGVSRLVTLSIVGVDRVPGYGYFQSKLAHENAARAGPIPATILRATQFYEFPAQILARARVGPLAVMPAMRVQPVAARSVGQLLADMAAEQPAEQTVEVAGPEPADLVSLARAIIHQRHLHVRIIPLPLPGAAGKAMRSGTLLPLSGVRIVTPSFGEWLTTDDAQAPKL